MRPVLTLLSLALACGPTATAAANNANSNGAAPGPAEMASRSEQSFEPRAYVRLQSPEWASRAVIYQLNTRQFTAAGTFEAARAQLPRLRDLGVDIVWLMPIHPIGELHRKGTLGSPYAVRDYYGVNPEFGDFADLKRFVATAHELGLKVILDWVANHTAWDNPLVDQHPDWYARDWNGDFMPTPWWDWSDIIDLDLSQAGPRRYLAEAMAWWVREADVDGFRCDVAGYLPTDFWEAVRVELERIKPVFLLAEAEFRDLHAAAFDASYAWTWHNAVHEIAMGRADVSALYRYYSENESAWPRAAMRMLFVSNHDKNSWEGTQFELFGEALQNAIALSVVGEGIPLIYNGQEAGNEKRLAFFEKDPIEWRQHPIGDLYGRLFALKKRLSPLGNGAWGARMIPVGNDAPARVLSFVRRDREAAVLALFNFSGATRSVRLLDGPVAGTWREALPPAGRAPGTLDLEAGAQVTLSPWSFRIYERSLADGDDSP